MVGREAITATACIPGAGIARKVARLRPMAVVMNA